MGTWVLCPLFNVLMWVLGGKTGTFGGRRLKRGPEMLFGVIHFGGSIGESFRALGCKALEIYAMLLTSPAYLMKIF